MYVAKCIETKIKFVLKEDENINSSYTGLIGLLSIYISEHKDVGRPYIVFTTSDSVLQTSTGDLDINVDNMMISIKTKQENIYSFKVLKKVNIVGVGS